MHVWDILKPPNQDISIATFLCYDLPPTLIVHKDSAAHGSMDL